MAVVWGTRNYSMQRIFQNIVCICVCLSLRVSLSIAWDQMQVTMTMDYSIAAYAPDPNDCPIFRCWLSDRHTTYPPILVSPYATFQDVLADLFHEVWFTGIASNWKIHHNNFFSIKFPTGVVAKPEWKDDRICHIFVDTTITSNEEWQRND